jgi:hypothetical protein
MLKAKNYYDQIDKEENKLLNYTIPISNSNYDDSKTLPTVTKMSEDWKFVEFHLKSSLTTEIQINKIISLYNQHMIINFEKRTKGKLFTYGWYNLREKFDEKNVLNYLTKLKTKGFEFSEEGLEFTVGKLIPDEKIEDANNDIESVYVLCKIIVGKSLCQLEGFEVKSPQNAYDSIVMCSSDSNVKKLKPLQYKIFNSTNVLPIFCVYFSPRDASNYVSSKYLCVECHSVAESYCINCEEYLCNDCFAKLHYGDGLNEKMKQIFEKHKREEFKKPKIRPGKCAFGDDKDVEFYCLDCKQAICSYCCVVGSHSKGHAGSHKLEHISKVYNDLNPDNFPKSQESELNFEKKKTEGIEKLEKVKKTIIDIKSKNLKVSIEKVVSVFDEQFKHLEQKTQESMTKHLSIMNQLIVIKDTINWLDNYFLSRENHLRMSGNRPELIWVRNHHGRIVQEVMNNKSLVETDFKYDYKEFERASTAEIYVVKYQEIDESASIYNREKSKEWKDKDKDDVNSLAKGNSYNKQKYIFYFILLDQLIQKGILLLKLILQVI